MANFPRNNTNSNSSIYPLHYTKENNIKNNCIKYIKIKYFDDISY